MENKKELVVKREFEAPLQLVFDSFTKPEHLKNWWAPKGLVTSYCSVDLRVGGLFRYCMTTPDGNNFWGRGVYQEIVSPTKIVYRDSFTDPEGNPVAPSYYGLQVTEIAEAIVEIHLAQVGRVTEVTLKYISNAELGDEVAAAEQGWNEMLDALDRSMKELTA